MIAGEFADDERPGDSIDDEPADPNAETQIAPSPVIRGPWTDRPPSPYALPVDAEDHLMILRHRLSTTPYRPSAFRRVSPGIEPSSN